MTRDEVQKLALGLYRLHWKEGGSSLAAVGMTYSGKRWFAPVNWTAEDADFPSIAVTHVWRKVDHVTFILDNS